MNVAESTLGAPSGLFNIESLDSTAPATTLAASMLREREQAVVQHILDNFQTDQLNWLAGYLTGLNEANTRLLGFLQQRSAAPPSQTTATQPSNGTAFTTSATSTASAILVLYGSKSGNSKKAASCLYEALCGAGFPSRLEDMNRYNPAQIKDERTVLFVVSTHGEGDPPPAAEDLHAFLNSRKAPKLTNTQFAVLALGDKSYVNYCQTGKDFDERLVELGAKRLVERAECDVEFEETAHDWIRRVLEHLPKEQQTQQSPQHTQHLRPPFNGLGINGVLGDGVPSNNSIAHKPHKNLHSGVHSRKNPFAAEILEKIQLNGRGSGKETYHLELSLAESGINYCAGDTLGIYASNGAELVDELLNFTGLDGTKAVAFRSKGQSQKEQSLRDALLHDAELTTISKDTLERYAAHAHNEHLSALLAGKGLGEYVYGRDVLDVLKEFPLPQPLDEQSFVELLRPFQPRLYSIASSLHESPDEVHVTVGRVRYTTHNRSKHGVCSNFLATQLHKGDTVRVFVEENESFRLPANADASVIMVGAGTGIAPFRAFVQERAAAGAQGKNWLLFGDRHFTTDFLYQLEWQRALKNGSLHRITTAFSRDTAEKIYVQHRLQQHAREVYAWLQEGAYFYVCGDAKQMAKDVYRTLVNIVRQQGGIAEEQAVECVRALRKEGRYQEDVY